MTEIEEGNIPEEEVPAEAPAEEVADVAPDVAPNEEGIPQWRFNEVNEARKAAEERAQMYEDALRQNGVRQQPSPSPPAPKPESMSDDQKWLQDAFNPVLDEYMKPIKQQMESVLDVQKKDTFWGQYQGKVPQDVVSQVEEAVSTARAQGLPPIDREYVLDYVLGKYHRNEMMSKSTAATNTQQQVRETNKVAVAESGSTTTEPPDKSIDQMSASELMAKYGNVPFDNNS